MFALKLKLFAATEPDWVQSAIYEHLAQTYKLPTVAGIVNEQGYLLCEQDVQVYYLENMREASKSNVFQVRFKTSKEAHDFTDIFLSVRNEAIQNMTLSFPSRGDRYCHAKVLGWLKEIANNQQTALQFEVEGFAESYNLKFIRETHLSAFVWEASLSRYLHVSDQSDAVRRMNRGNA
jgi:hypothetical protein